MFPPEKKFFDMIPTLEDALMRRNFMGIKEISTSILLVRLPHPWSMTHSMQRDEELERLNCTADSLKIALDVLNRCLYILSRETLPPVDAVPESLMEYWGFTAEWLADEMPTLDEFNLHKIDKLLKEYGTNSPLVLKQLASYWLWWLTYDIEEAILDWMRDNLRGAKNHPYVPSFLAIVSRYWDKLSPRMTESLLLASASIGRQKALPLLDSIERDSSAKPSIRKSAQDYRRWIVGMEDKREILPREREQMLLAA